MPTYCFEDVATGQRTERLMPMSAAPRYGQTITDPTDPSRQLRRVVELEHVNLIAPIKPYKTRVIPRRTAGFKHDADGRCIVETRKQEQDYCRANGYEMD